MSSLIFGGKWPPAKIVRIDKGGPGWASKTWYHVTLLID